MKKQWYWLGIVVCGIVYQSVYAIKIITSLKEVIAMGDVRRVEQIVNEQGVEVLNEALYYKAGTNLFGNPIIKETLPLHYAALNGRRKIVEYFIAQGVQKDVKDKARKTAYQYAQEGLKKAHSAQEQEEYTAIMELLG
jgi:hypothetical protein